MSTEKQNQYFNGIKFYKRADNAYWYSCTTVNGKRVYMHRYVWEYYNKPIPKDYAIHHIDLDRDNNDISNLQYLPKKEHAKLHANLNKQNEETVKKWRGNLEKAQEKAKEWHKSEEGRKWHKEHAKKCQFGKFTFGIKKCIVCGEEFEAKKNTQRFCSNKCKAKYRRINGLDRKIVKCPVCGKEFETEKYNGRRFCSHECKIKALYHSDDIMTLKEQ